MTFHDAISLRTLAVLGTGGLLTALAATHPAARTADVQPAAISIPDVTPVATSTVAADDAPRAAPYDLHFTFTAGGATWLALSDATGITTRGNTRLVHDDSDDWFAIAAVRELPAVARGWLDHDVTLDGGCRESLHDFAVIHLASGYPEGDANGRWTARSIAAQGSAVLAAKLTHCTGAFASVAPFHRFEIVTDPDLIARAKSLVLASTFAAKAAADWRAMNITTAWTDDADIDTVVARDAGITYVSVHVQAGGIGCGSPTANFWGLYRAGAGGSLEQLQLRDVDFGRLDALVDIDGRLGFLGEALFPAGPILVDSQGDTRASLITPYFGCPC